jgi:autophagy-related protein 33
MLYLRQPSLPLSSVDFIQRVVDLQSSQSDTCELFDWSYRRLPHDGVSHQHHKVCRDHIVRSPYRELPFTSKPNARVPALYTPVFLPPIANISSQGVSYSLSTITLPALALLPSAARASRTLTSIQQKSTRQILTLASISSLSLITAYSLASPRGKHPYLLWTALVAFVGGQGVEYWYNGLSRFPSVKGSAWTQKDGSASGFVDVGAEAEVNGEQVEMEMCRERRVQRIRSLVTGLGFAMGVVGIWGDGA